nr:RNA-dependent RNA polymerase [Totiviridae sp.]
MTDVSRASKGARTNLDRRICNMFKRASMETQPVAGNPVDLKSKLRRNRDLYAVGYDCGEAWQSYRGALNLHAKMTRWAFPRTWRAIAKTHPVSDEHANKILKAWNDLLAESFENTKDARLFLFTGLNTCGAPRRATKEEVHAGVKEWIQGEVTLFSRFKSWGRRWLWSFVSTWFNTMTTNPSERLSLAEFLDDPTRWATSGSAPAVDVGGVTFRNKWAWASDIIKNYGNVSSWYQKVGRHMPAYNTVARVALKEESTKVRLVLAAPPASHLRQSYILSYLGAPKYLRSTVTYPDITQELSEGWTSLCGLDSSKFDHNVPGWFVTDFFRFIWRHAAARGLNDLADAAMHEAYSIEHTFVKTPLGQVKWHKGVLSGWRVTSLLDSMVSQAICDFIADNTKVPFDFMVQGDDIMLRSWGLMDTSEIVRQAKRLGVIINEAKSTTGMAGEFLKYLYTPDGAVGYPGRGLRSIFWANPWIPELQSKSPKQVVGNWMTYFSRLRCFLGARMPDWPTLKGYVVRDLRRWAGGDPGWAQFLDTPGSVGGGCVLEFDNGVEGQVLHVSPDPVFKKVIQERLVGAEVVFYRLGAFRSALNATKSTRLVRLRRPPPELFHELPDGYRQGWRAGVNRLKTFCEWLGVKTGLLGITQKISEFTWPRAAWSWGPGKRIDWLLQTETVTRSDSLTTSRLYDRDYMSLWQKSWNTAVYNSTVFPSRLRSLRFSLGLDEIAKRASTIFFSL